MNGRYALDTNIVIALIDRDASVRDRIARADEVFIPSPVLGELFFGAFHSRRVVENVARVDQLARDYPVFPVDEMVAKTYGELRHELLIQGKPVPENDLWIAAIAKRLSATVATRDQHFKDIDGLSVEMW